MSISSLPTSNTPLANFSFQPNSKASIEFESISASPTFENSLIKTYLSSQEMEGIITPILKDLISKTHFNHLNLICQFIDHYNQLDEQVSYKISPLKALQTFSSDKQKNKEITNGLLCWEFIENTIKELPNFINCNLVPASSPREQKYHHRLCHMAAIIAYVNPKSPQDEGFIILDPTLGFNQPIIVPFHGVSEPITAVAGHTYVFSHKNDTIVATISDPSEIDKDQDLELTYFLQKITNFGDVSIKSCIGSIRKIHLMTFGDSIDNSSDLCIELDKEIIRWAAGPNYKRPISFNEFLFENFQIDQTFCYNSFLDINQINNSIKKIILNKSLFNTLYSEYVDFLKKNPRNQEFFMDT